MSIASALAQNEQKCKVLIVDNNPGVDRWYIPLDHPGLTYIKNETNIGVKNFAKCWSLVDTDYIHFLGDDDFMLPSYVDALDEIIQAHEDEFVAISSLPCHVAPREFKLYSHCLSSPANASTALERTKQVTSKIAFNFWWYSLIDRRKVSYNRTFDQFFDLWPLSCDSSDWLFTYWLATRGKMLFCNKLGFIYNYQNWSGDWHQNQLIKFRKADLKSGKTFSMADIHQLSICHQVLMIYAFYVYCWQLSAGLDRLSMAELKSIVAYLCFLKISREMPMGLSVNCPLVELANGLKADGSGLGRLVRASTISLLANVNKETLLAKFVQIIDEIANEYGLESCV